MNRGPQNRTEALCQAFGWQGGTIHQVAAETGCEVADLLYANPSAEYINSEYSKGWFAGRTCNVQFNKETNFPGQKGNLDFWLGVADGLAMELAERAVH